MLHLGSTEAAQEAFDGAVDECVSDDETPFVDSVMFWTLCGIHLRPYRLPSLLRWCIVRSLRKLRPLTLNVVSECVGKRSWTWLESIRSRIDGTVVMSKLKIMDESWWFVRLNALAGYTAFICALAEATISDWSTRGALIVVEALAFGWLCIHFVVRVLFTPQKRLRTPELERFNNIAVRASVPFAHVYCSCSSCSVYCRV